LRRIGADTREQRVKIPAPRGAPATIWQRVTGNREFTTRRTFGKAWIMTKQTTAPAQQAPQLSETERKLLKHIQSQAPVKPSWVKFLSNTVCGFYW
jgi:hypothetical protein